MASGGRYLEKDERDIPDSFMMMVDYPSEHTVVLVSVMTNDLGVPDIIRGQYGTMKFENGIALHEQAAWADEFRKANSDTVTVTTETDDDGKQITKPANGRAVSRHDVQGRRDHMGNFLDAVRNGDRLSCNVDLGASTMVAIKMAVESYRQDKVMLWDAETETMRPA